MEGNACFGDPGLLDLIDIRRKVDLVKEAVSLNESK
jgi:hypothetical protein